MMHHGPLDHINPLSLMPPLKRMRLGFFETNTNGHEVIGHLGDTDDFHTPLPPLLDDGVGLFASFNIVGKDRAAPRARLDLFQEFADRYYPSTREDGKIDHATAIKHARMMAGKWEFARRSEGNFFALTNYLGQIRVSAEADGDLVVDSIMSSDAPQFAGKRSRHSSGATGTGMPGWQQMQSRVSRCVGAGT